MRLFYYKCICGEEFRDIIPDKTDEEKIAEGMVRGKKPGTWEYYYDPNRKKTPAPDHSLACIKCGAKVEPSPDPKGVRTMFLFNYLSEDYSS